MFIFDDLFNFLIWVGLNGFVKIIFDGDIVFVWVRYLDGDLWKIVVNFYYFEKL